MSRRFSTFEGVFTPCLLSILGVIMYLRLGWVVGNAGFLGTLFIIILANVITLTTALSMSSIVTNIRIGAGGAYSIITKSLGVEAGGAVGIPLYISQAISVAFYIAGFTECWSYVFPLHNPLIVSLSAWLFLAVVAFTSTKLAFKLQYFIMGVIVLSLVSIFMSDSNVGKVAFEWHSIEIENFWGVFAIFFPAVTGILTGASMSGELEDPRVAIPKGTLAAIFVSLGVYILMAYLFASKVDSQTLIANRTIVIDMGRWQWMVIAGIMGATISSAIGMFVGAPRVLLALGTHSIIPFSKSFSRVSVKGEPTTAVLFTALIALVTILFSSLDQIATFLTMFFLITYGMINLIVFAEQSMGIASFRPTFRVSRLISFIGSCGCLAVMLLIDAKFSLASIVIITLIYYILLKREARTYSPDIRSGMLIFLAEKFAKLARNLPYYPKIWKPNVIIPLSQHDDFQSIAPFVRALSAPAGRITAVHILENQMLGSLRKEQLQELLESSVEIFKENEMFIETGVVEAESFSSGTKTVIQTLCNMHFPPNTMFSVLGKEPHCDINTSSIMDSALQEGLGVVLLYKHPKVSFLQEKIINLWIRPHSPNINLSVLLALQLERNWEGYVRILQAVDKPYQKEESEIYLHKLKGLMRMPVDVEVNVLVGDFRHVLKESPPADINIFGMQDKPDIAFIREISDSIKTSILFVHDSKHESALA